MHFIKSPRFNIAGRETLAKMRRNYEIVISADVAREELNERSMCA
jgi:hypothetical protein